ncbi:MAG TPA: alpha-ketoglutarate-dependent dioxygenase AlkB [Candidatus Acidoferrales bacterium]|nr:alpha-ketoglutarate-dependent dioxygenase AlkB [Candidatus Acidoferrales bacterium]
MQLSFLGDGRRVLVDDETGRIEYVPGFVEPERARAWFDRLRDGVAWRSERRMMYDREVDVPRLVASFRLADGDAPGPIVEAQRRVVEMSGTPFTNVGLNLYRDGRDSVAPHNDHTDEIVAGHPIALVSLGAARRMTIRSKARPIRRYDLDLEPGSLLVMSYETQTTYDHGIPKTNEPVGERISMAFRVRR